MSHPFPAWNHSLDQQAGTFFAANSLSPCRHNRSDSITSSSGDNGEGNDSNDIKALKQTRQLGHTYNHVRTRSVAFGTSIVIERDYTKAPSDDDIIIVTVRMTSSFRKNSLEGCDELPSRPRPRSFLRRMSTRWHGPIDEDQWKALKMPRSEYKRFFARDKDRNYVGTEPEREWDENDLMREFGVYQDLPLRSILC
ncbi:Hypothetical protein R9X50_00094900 [Acrodontium crateriforme]|uniref:Uncharacterized protein n=1 Tax=Acrodontium crateriforme TaxID=150365 RepID=A0AAQ3LYH2_9PEZI|nr:Hypothetical protein R9X50_00094900 [Acrodontium crateriforme]